MSRRFVIKHKNITGMKSYELKDYINDLKEKERIEGLTIREMELLEKAMEERDMRRKCKVYYPEKDRKNDFLKGCRALEINRG